MTGNKSSKTKRVFGLKAQAIVEFAIALPVFLMLIVGIFEVGRLMFIYSAVTNSSRSAARYASAYGLNDSGNLRYLDCASIKNIAIRSAYLMTASNLTVTIDYDHGPGFASYDTCDGNIDTSVVVKTGDRVHVQVVAQYKPMVKLIPIPARTITSSSYRTILGIVDLGK